MKTNKGELLQTEVPNYVEGRLEEADTLTRHPHPTPSPDTLTRHPHPTSSTDTLIAFYASSISSGNFLMRSTHTDVLAILLRLVDVPAVISLCLLVVRFQNL